ncbi:MAG: hypothetical protein JF592_03860, partial [Microbacterium sp.]|nr:hypothetical protein [Microbacterium sp.]
GINVRGWAIDPDSASATSVHLYVDSSSVAVLADRPRTDLVAHYPLYGEKHGFETKLMASPGRHSVCAYGINVGPGAPALLGCKDVDVPGAVDLGRPPIGSLESATLKDNVATVSGWALDLDTTAPISVHLYVGSSSAAYVADKDRSDVGAAYPAYGPKHGFVETLTLPVGTSNVCAYAINNGVGGHLLLGCRSLTVVAPVVDKGRAPIGNFETATASSGAITVSGWALDLDTANPINVHVYVDSASAAYVADKARPDVGAAYPGLGSAHGFAQTIPVTAGQHQVCVYAINNGAGGHTSLGCRTVTVPAPTVDKGRGPIGNFEGVQASVGGATVSGWALDPDTADPIQIHIYVDNSSAAYTANRSRPDVGAAYGLGANHGFAELVPMAAGTHQVCVYAINNGVGGHAFLGCRSVVVS